MSKSVWKEKILLSSERAHAKIKRTGSLEYVWSSDKTDDLEFIQKTQKVIKKFVGKRIDSDKRDILRCSIDEVLDTDSKVVAQKLVLKYLEGAEFDIESLVDAIQGLVNNSLQAMIQVAEQEGSDPHKIKIITSSELITSSSSEADIVQVGTEDEKSLSRTLVAEVLAKNRRSNTIGIKLDGVERKFDLVRASNVAVESDDDCNVKCKVVAVNDYRSEVIISEFGKASVLRNYIFKFEHRETLLKAQLHGYLVSIVYKPSKKFKNGESVEVGGEIYSVVGLETEQII